MIIFLNLDGTAEKVVPQHIFQGSGNIIDVTVFSGYPPNTRIDIAFKLPDGTQTQYSPMLYVPTIQNPQVAAYSYTMPDAVTAYAGDTYVALNVKFANGNRTSFLVKFIVEPSTIPVLPPAPTPDVYDLITRYLQQNSAMIANLEGRVTTLEEVNVRKSLLDFSAYVAGNVLTVTKLYTDGTSSVFTLPWTGTGGDIYGSGLVVVSFKKESFYNTGTTTNPSDIFELAIPAAATGMVSSEFLADLSIPESYIYEVGQETAPTLKNGFTTIGNKIFKGSDGSVLITGVRRVFDGRLICFNGRVPADVGMVTDIRLTADDKNLIVRYKGGVEKTLIFAKDVPFTVTVLPETWNATADGFFYNISAVTHGKGTYPTVQVKGADNAFVGVKTKISAEGNIEFTAAVNKQILIIIKE